ncbi:MAG: pyridoxal phosphate-dependent aminotransferase [Candidatus Riflebacteria bacterium]|nr:pyridoxal phosphate-dependent aminotransferase [Candidatus Riflebacteria bacterium]
MTTSLSKRSKFIEKAEIRTMTVECEKVGGINLAQGVCDTGTPQIILDNVNYAMKQGINTYTRHDGLQIIREAIAKKLLRDNSISVDPETEIVVSAGSTGAFYCACFALLDPGDEVLLFEPYYGYHLNTLEACEAIPAFVTLRPPDWSFSVKELEKAITSRTKGIMICTPSNPCGKIFSREELLKIAELAIKHDFFIFTDEIYEYILYDGAKHISPGSIKEIADRVVTIGGYSKTYSITGWRIGFAACRAKWAEMIGYLNDLVYVCAPAPLQYGVAKGIDELPKSFYDNLALEYKKKRDMICNSLRKAGMPPWVPAGSYYVLVDASKLPGKTSKAKAMFLLEKTGVAAVPGDAFYHGTEGDNILRFCYAKTTEVLEKASKKLEELDF